MDERRKQQSDHWSADWVPSAEWREQVSALLPGAPAEFLAWRNRCLDPAALRIDPELLYVHWNPKLVLESISYFREREIPFTKAFLDRERYSRRVYASPTVVRGMNPIRSAELARFADDN